MATYTLPITPTSTGQIYITATGNAGGGSGGMWSNTIHPTTQFGSINGKPVMEIPNNSDPSIRINGKIEWNGEDLHERLKRIETMLNIPTRDAIMEEKYSKLKKINDEYNKALAEYKTWETLKDSK
jgi:hypothetical protein